MNILQIHNTYKLKGGEDSVLDAESELLRSNGNSLKLFLADNSSLNGRFNFLSAAINSTYSIKSRREIKIKLDKHSLDIAHVHNFFPIISPSVYDACRDAGVPTIQTLHNFRTICPGALLMREGAICEKCVTGSTYQSVLHGCYRGSRLGTMTVARMVDYHRKNHTWSNKVDRFIALTHFAKHKFIQAGFPESKIVVKPNFYSGIGVPNNIETTRTKSALFVGRISVEKGVSTLLQAWESISTPIRIVGTGPLYDKIQHCTLEHLTSLGQLTSEQVSSEMAQAAFLVMPSEWYETFGLVIIEAFAHGLPVVASNLGAMAEIVDDGVTGLHFEAGNAEDLATKVRWMSEHPKECRQMGYNARREFEAKYTPERNYEMLMNIYQEAIEEVKGA